MDTKREEFHVCNQETCRFYAEWMKAWNEKETALAVTSVGRKKPDGLQALIWCLTCKHFQKQDNFIQSEGE